MDWEQGALRMNIDWEGLGGQEAPWEELEVGGQVDIQKAELQGDIGTGGLPRGHLEEAVVGRKELKLGEGPPGCRSLSDTTGWSGKMFDQPSLLALGRMLLHRTRYYHSLEAGLNRTGHSPRT